MQVHAAPELALGTVQFGRPYGISNRRGMLSVSEIEKVLVEARRRGIDLLDTATGYGESEARLGDALKGTASFAIVTKTPEFFASKINAEHERQLRDAFSRSLDRLKQKRVYGLLVHAADDLLAPRGERLMDAVLDFRSRGLTGKIGVSIYSESQLSKILSRYKPDIIQLPINVVDQRLLQSGMLRDLRAAGIEIHARSAFLQGLLLMTPDEIPSHLGGLRPTVQAFHSLCRQKGVSPVGMALAFLRETPVNRVVVGVTGADELAEIADAWDAGVADKTDFSRFAVKDENLLNPARWASLQTS